MRYFGAGPAPLPRVVIEATAQAILQYHNTGLSLLELPHRGKYFAAMQEEANALVLELAGLSAEQYQVLWLQGGGRLQFAMIPANFLGYTGHAGYQDSGHWAQDAFQTATHYGDARILNSSSEASYATLPPWPDEDQLQGLSYLHVTTNNTIYGTQMPDPPACAVPIIADMSSDIFGTQRDYSRYDFFYAAAQKNLGPAGVTLVVAKKEFLQKGATDLPSYLSYAAHVKANGVLNTMPVPAIYSSLLTLRWLKSKGLKEQILENKRKAAQVYAALEESPHFFLHASPQARSNMNIVFTAASTQVQNAFEAYCRIHSLEGLEGHRSVGGFRASLYNAVSVEDAEFLAQAIRSFRPDIHSGHGVNSISND